MVKTIRVPDEYHAWLKAHTKEGETIASSAWKLSIYPLKAHTKEGETMGETLRRLTHTPPPAEAVITPDQADGMHEAVKRLRESDRNRLSRVADRLDETDIE